MNERFILFGVVFLILIILIILAAIFDFLKIKKISEFFERVVAFISELRF